MFANRQTLTGCYDTDMDVRAEGEPMYVQHGNLAGTCMNTDAEAESEEESKLQDTRTGCCLRRSSQVQQKPHKLNL